jgi:hypothetical protein
MALPVILFKPMESAGNLLHMKKYSSQQLSANCRQSLVYSLSLSRTYCRKLYLKFKGLLDAESA